MGKYNFDEVINRRGSGCIKFDNLKEFYGNPDLQPMWIADMDFKACPEIAQALQRRMAHTIYGYANPTDSYWESITTWLKHRHNFKVERDELTFVPGVVKGIALVINFFTRKGDKVVIQPPVYHPFRLLTEGNERVVVENPLIADADGNYTMDLPGLEKAFATEHPKLMILCNPHNPIGLQWSRETLTEVGRLARKYGVTVISDEIHGDLMLKHRQHVPFADCGDDCAAVGITFGAPSKTFNIPGLVSSWCVIKNEELRKPFFNWLTVNELNSPTFVATIGTEAAYNHGEPWLDELLTYLQGNLDAMDAFIKAQMPQVSMVMPQASFLAWVDFSRLHLTHDELINLVEQRAGLAFNDGEMFGVAQGRGFMRVNVAMPRALLLEALQKLADAVNSL